MAQLDDVIGRIDTVVNEIRQTPDEDYNRLSELRKELRELMHLRGELEGD